MRAAGTSHDAATATATAAATTVTQGIASPVAAASGGLYGHAARDFCRYLEAFKNGARTCLAGMGSMAAVGRLRRLPGGAVRPGSDQLV